MTDGRIDGRRGRVDRSCGVVQGLGGGLPTVGALVAPPGRRWIGGGTARCGCHRRVADADGDHCERDGRTIVWCVTAHPLEPLLASLRAHVSLAVPDDCVVHEVVLDKR